MSTRSGTPAPSRSPRLRVAQLIEAMTSGGAERLAVQIANARAEAGELSYLYVVASPGDYSPIISEGVRMRYLNHDRAFAGNPVTLGVSVLRGYRLLAARIAGDRVGVVQTHLPGANFLGLLLAMRRVCAVVPTVHNNQEFRYGRDDQIWRAKLRRRAYREMLRRCPALVAVSQEARDSLVAELDATAAEAARIRVIPNGVNVPALLDSAAGALARAKYGIPPGDPMVLAGGRLSEQKNHVLLLEAVARLRRMEVRCRVMIAGDGPLRSYLERRVEEMGIGDRVLLPGNVDDLEDLMLGADIFALPSLWEGLPLVLLEAMARRLPIVATRIKGVADVVEDGVSGLLVEPGDAAGFADALAALLRDPPRRAALGAAGREIVSRHYDFERVCQQLSRLYEEVAPST